MNNLLKTDNVLKKNEKNDENIINKNNKIIKSNEYDKNRLDVLKLKLCIKKYLPNELIQFIRKLSYKTQPEDLLRDFRHFHKTHKIVKDTYIYDNIRNNLLEINVNDMSMIQNNILYYGVGNIYNIFNRLYNKLNKQKIINFMEGFVSTHKYALKKFNTYWGLMSIKERENFINLIEDLKYKNSRYNFYMENEELVNNTNFYNVLDIMNNI
jgi:hypothetical protein